MLMKIIYYPNKWKKERKRENISKIEENKNNVKWIVDA